jgi:ribosome-associated protein
VSSEELARRVAVIADAKQAVDILALDMRGLVGYTDFLVICTARNERQAKAVHDEVHASLKRDGLLPEHVEGARGTSWVLMDYLDCVLHVFVPEARDYYRLEALWGEAPRLDLGLEGASPRAAAGGAQP